MKRNNYFWATFLILGGGLLLLSNLGILTINVWGLLWPMFLIMAGAWFLLGSRFGYPSAEVEESAIPLEGAARARVRINHGARPSQTRSFPLSIKYRIIAQPAGRSSFAGVNTAPCLTMIWAIVCWLVPSRRNMLLGSPTLMRGFCMMPSAFRLS